MTSFEGNELKLNEQNEAIPWSELRFMGAYSKCYLFFEHGDRMLVIDQHAFHERVLYERLKNDRDQLCRNQNCLVPELFYFSASEISHLESRREEIEDFGFTWNKIDSSSIEVTSVPALLVGKDIEAVFSQLAKSNSRKVSNLAPLKRSCMTFFPLWLATQLLGPVRNYLMQSLTIS